MSSEPATVERLMAEVWRYAMRMALPRPGAEHLAVARQTVAEESGSADSLTTNLLARALARALCEVRSKVGLADTAPETKVEASRLWDGALWLDEGLARHLERGGDSGRTAARALRKSAHRRAQEFASGSAQDLRQLWELWVAGSATASLPEAHARYVRLLARVIWRDEVRELAERAKRKPPALPIPVVEDLSLVHRNDLTVTEDHRCFVMSGQRCVDGVQFVPTTTVNALETISPQRLPALGGLAAHRVLRWEIAEGHLQVLEREPDPRVLTVVGGWTELARLAGMPAGNRAAAEVQAVVRAQAHLRFSLPGGGTGNLVVYQERRPSNGRSALVTITLGDALLPGLVHSMVGKSLRAREQRRLVPILPIPPMVGRPREYAGQAALQLELLIELRRRVRELVQRGGVTLTAQTWRQMAERANLPSRVLPRVLERWTVNDGDEPALLTELDRHVYTLSEVHADARRFLEAAGRMELQGQRAGQATKRHRVRETPPSPPGSRRET